MNVPIVEEGDVDVDDGGGGGGDTVVEKIDKNNANDDEQHLDTQGEKEEWKEALEDVGEEGSDDAGDKEKLCFASDNPPVGEEPVGEENEQQAKQADIHQEEDLIQAVALKDMLIKFLKAVTHSFLFYCHIYPRATFITKTLEGIHFKMCNHPLVKSYIKRIGESVSRCLLDVRSYTLIVRDHQTLIERCSVIVELNKVDYFNIPSTTQMTKYFQTFLETLVKLNLHFEEVNKDKNEAGGLWEVVIGTDVQNQLDEEGNDEFPWMLMRNVKLKEKNMIENNDLVCKTILRDPDLQMHLKVFSGEKRKKENKNVIKTNEEK